MSSEKLPTAASALEVNTDPGWRLPALSVAVLVSRLLDVDCSSLCQSWMEAQATLQR